MTLLDPVWLVLALPLFAALWRFPLPTRLTNVLRAATILLVLLGASSLIFKIACANVVNLVLARTVRREYSRPYVAHASMGPSCAVAQWSDAWLHVWTHSQGVFALRGDLAKAFGMDAKDIR